MTPGKGPLHESPAIADHLHVVPGVSTRLRGATRSLHCPCPGRVPCAHRACVACAPPAAIQSTRNAAVFAQGHHGGCGACTRWPRATRAGAGRRSMCRVSRESVSRVHVFAPRGLLSQATRTRRRPRFCALSKPFEGYDPRVLAASKSQAPAPDRVFPEAMGRFHVSGLGSRVLAYFNQKIKNILLF